MKQNFKLVPSTIFPFSPLDLKKRPYSTCLNLFFIVIFYLVFSLKIFSYTPGKWSPLDRNVMGLEELGPASEIVKTADGKILYTAYYEYDKKGRLALEKYLDNEGNPHGETRYGYDRERIILEETYTTTSGLVDKRVFKYNTNGDLKEIILSDKDGKEIQKCKVSFMSREFITEGELKWTQSKDTEIFQIPRSELNGNIWNLEITDEKKKQIGTIKLHFDEKGKLIRRENIQPGFKRRSELKYDDSGRLVEFSYSVLSDTNWVVQKIHYLSY